MNCPTFDQYTCYLNTADCYYQPATLTAPGICMNATCWNYTTSNECTQKGCSSVGTDTASPYDFLCYTPGASKAICNFRLIWLYSHSIVVPCSSYRSNTTCNAASGCTYDYGQNVCYNTSLPCLLQRTWLVLQSLMINRPVQ